MIVLVLLELSTIYSVQLCWLQILPTKYRTLTFLLPVDSILIGQVDEVLE